MQYNTGVEVEIRPSALKHDVTGESIAHAIAHPLLVDEEFEGDESSKVLVLGTDSAGNLLEVIGEFDVDDVFSVFHAMPARAGYVRLLNRKETK